MRERDIVMTELWKRVTAVEGVKYTSRNPSVIPSNVDMPVIQLFELGDVVKKIDSRGQIPYYTRELTVAVEAFISATDEKTATQELVTFINKIKKAIYAGGPTLNKTCQYIRETEMSRVLRPQVGALIVGIGLIFSILYIEDISKIS